MTKHEARPPDENGGFIYDDDDVLFDDRLEAKPRRSFRVPMVSGKALEQMKAELERLRGG